MKTIEDAVRNYNGEWPFSDELHTLYWCSVGKYFTTNPNNTEICCTRIQFEECARRLRNEPDWKDAPDWAVAKAQDSAGEWYWYEVVPRPNTAMFKGFPGKSKYAGYGEVIGDWRKTLRLRPEEKKRNAIMKTISETEVAYRKALEKVLEDSKCGVVPKSHIKAIEDLLGANQKEDKNDWYAKGEFPTVGTVCRRRFATTGDVVVTITYVGDGVLCYRDEKGMEYTAASAHIELRPIQIERERLIEKACKVVSVSGSIKETVTQLADAGMLKMPEDK